MGDAAPSSQVQTLTVASADKDAQVAKRGDHLIVFRPLISPIGYYHHGIYVGGGKVIHYAGRSAKDAIIRHDNVATFSDGGEVRIICHNDGKCYLPEKVVQQAASYLGSKCFKEEEYGFFLNNCEHFSRWCKTGIAESKQTQRIFTTVAGGVMGRQVVTQIVVRVLGFAGPVGWAIIAAITIGSLVGFTASTEISKKAIFTEDE